LNTKNIFFGILITLLYSCHQSDPEVKEYSLIWEDQFNGSEINTDHWEFQLGDGAQYGLWRWGNNEQQYYKKENARVSNGKLLIKAVAEEYNGYDYTSARIRTKNLADFQHGKIEASIRMSDAKGLWHAFWLLPTNPSENWPMSGEIDIMEFIGNEPFEILNTVHFANNFDQHQYLGGTTQFANDKDFHVYSIEWDENKIIWYLDDSETYRILRSHPQIANNWPFNAEFHILLNTAVGGNLGGEIDHAALMSPKYMEVDYVKVYQKK
tara:strand:- start:1429 stop:2229 length:801 start_codon:yes stop_codon:yes gene_type:complete